MTLGVLLAEYLSTMKEDSELDVLLPMVVNAMGHEIVSRPQRGVRQNGADMTSIGKDSDGTKKLFVWVIKCGDIDRSAWGVGKQAVRPTLENLVDVYFNTSLTPSQKRLARKVCIVTNGVVRQEVQQDISGYLSTYQTKYGVETDEVNGETLARWTESYMLDERVLPEHGRSLMRRALANVDAPAISIEHARELINSLLDAIPAIKGAVKTKERRTLQQLRAIAVFNAVLLGWARRADNLESAYVTAEYTLLATWQLFHEDEWIGQRYVSSMYARYLSHYLVAADLYHERLAPYYRVEAAFAAALRDNCFVVERVFEEIGRLGLLASVFATLARAENGQLAAAKAADLSEKLVSLLATHTVSCAPCYDCHAVDISCGMVALIANNRRAQAHEWLRRLIVRLKHSRQSVRYAPISSDSFDELVAIRYGQLEPSDEMLNTSTLLPTLAFWCQVLDAHQEYVMLLERVAPLFEDTSLNLWFCDADYESLLASPYKLVRSGFAATMHLPGTMAQLAAAVPAPPTNVPNVERLQATKSGAPWLAMLASRHWRLQLPHDLVFTLARQLGASPDASRV